MKCKRIHKYDLDDLLKNGEVFLYEYMEDALIRLIRDENGKLSAHTKFKGKPEFVTSDKSTILERAICNPLLITKEQYENY
jgi:hypothetical protein